MYLVLFCVFSQRVALFSGSGRIELRGRIELVDMVLLDMLSLLCCSSCCFMLPCAYPSYPPNAGVVVGVQPVFLRFVSEFSDPLV